MRLKIPYFKKQSVSEESLLHDNYFNQLRRKEYHRLDDENHVYLDFTGGNLYAESQINKHFDSLKRLTLGNPHSTNPTSKLATQLVEETRQKVLSFFNAEDYFCVFTQNASAALQIIGECYPFDKEGKFLLLSDNHNSVNGIREYAQSKKASFAYVPMLINDLRLDEIYLENELTKHPNCTNKLFAFPAQSNVSGVKHDLTWIEKAQNSGWDVLLDAAAYVPTSPLDLKKYQPDFVSISFYKIFGFPTGIGCLLIKKDKFNKLQKPWFAGGTVSFVSVQSPIYYLINNHERYENGTINYLEIPAIKIGLEFIEEIGLQRINERVAAMRKYLFDNLIQLKHSNGQPQLKIFGPHNHQKVGGNIIFTVLNPDGKMVPYESVEKITNAKKISIRTGCFCNPGIDEINNCITSDELKNLFSNQKNIENVEYMTEIKRLRGAIRVSVGIATIKNDLDQLIELIKDLKDNYIN